MKVLLLEDVINLGLAGDVVRVADGYGRNYLVPRGLAKVATPGALKQADQIRTAGERKRSRQLASAQDLARRIEGLTLTFTARAGEKGKLYGSVTTADLAEEVERQLGEEFDRRKIVSDPLRQLGEHSVEVRLMSDVSAHLKVVIEPEEAEELEVPEELRAPLEEEEEEIAEDEVVAELDVAAEAGAIPEEAS
jgi:large subunit ribosomal protein L9